MKIDKKIKNQFLKIGKKGETIYTAIVISSVLVTVILMYFRAFYGVELTDEAYYVSEAKEMLYGNLPYSYNNSSKALGFTFPLIFLEWLYKLFVPNLEGVFLFTRLCFVTYKIFACAGVFYVLQRQAKKAYALLCVGMLLPIDGYMQNFSYNSIPIFTMILSGCLLYDVLEQNSSHKKAELIIAGFLSGVACFANPGWTVALLCFIALILLRAKKDRFIFLLIFGVAVLAEVLIVVLPIVIQTSFSELCYGLYRIFINPIPMDSLNPNKTWRGVIDSFRGPIRQWIKIFFPTAIFVFFFSDRYIVEQGEKILKKDCIILAITTGMLIHMIYLAYIGRGSDMQSSWGFVAFCYMIVYFVFGTYKKEKIIFYLGLYPPIYAVAEIIIVSSLATVVRFVNAYSILVPMIYVLLKHKSELVRIASTIIAVVITWSLIYADFNYVYRDADFRSLTTKVGAGVYKGIYTTKARAHDLPELEEYLNSIINENETYAFRDNVPSAYLMVHKGQMCEISTWDILQHSYHRNSPAPLFDYYRRRDMIPEKIIFVDFGRDENLSITEPDYRYNDWINAYYNLVEDKKLNETFFHVMVYQYNGKFDGNYQYWIDAYWELVK